MKYAIFKNNQFIKLTDEIIATNPEYMYYEIDLSDMVNKVESDTINKFEQKYSSIFQRIKFLFIGKL